MTATLPAPPAPPPGGRPPADQQPVGQPSAGQPSAGQPSSWDDGHGSARRTLLALLATALGITPLKALLSDDTWLIEAWFSMAVVLGPAALIRLRREPTALDIWPGIVLLVPWLTFAFLRHHAWGGFVPTGATVDQITHLMDDLHHTMRDETAPIHSTAAVRLVVCALVGLLAALVDLLAVVGRRAGLAGVPLLVVFTVSGAVPRSSVGWVWFVLAASGFLILLGLDAGDELRAWGRRISRRGAARTAPAFGVSAQRIGVLAVIVALIVPLLLPAQARNLIADAFHTGGHGIGGFGAGSGGNGAISPFAALKGQLDRSNPVTLAEVHVDGAAGSVPFYLKTNVLDEYTDDVGWSVSGHGRTESLTDTDFGTDVPGVTARSAHFESTIRVKQLSGNVPVFTAPRSLSGVDGGTMWSPQDGILLGASVRKNQEIREDFAQPEPTVAELEDSPRVADGQMTRWLDLPTLPAYVRDLVERLTADKRSMYDKARALSDYFADPANNFFYSLKTQPGDSGSALVDFLKNREGYCQQYAAALAVMLRQAGVPSRVVLGYMHAAPDRDGNFEISTVDAHAWVEAYFVGVGWVPFDPTPTAGLSGGKASDLAWAPHQYPKTGPDTRPRPSTTARAPQQSTTTRPSAAAAPASGTGTGSGRLATEIGLGLLVAVLVALLPAGIRADRRRRRHRAGRNGDTDALWQELRETVTDLGYSWSAARTPRQVSAWLGRDAGPTAPELAELAAAVERQRYAPANSTSPGAGPRLVAALRRVTGELRSRRSRRLRIGAVVWPASLGWTRPRRH